VICYLGTTENLGITYKAVNSDKGIGLHAYSDSDYAGDIDTRKSTSGYVFYAGNGLISWKSA
jgi:hypothetical protein